MAVWGLNLRMCRGEEIPVICRILKNNIKKLCFLGPFYLCIAKKVRGVAQLVSAPRSGRGGRKFESSHPDLKPEGSFFTETAFAIFIPVPLLWHHGCPSK